MLHRSCKKSWFSIVFVGACWFTLVPLFGQISRISNFERCSSYASTIANLNSTYYSQTSNALQLIAQRAEILNRLSASNRDLDELKAMGFFQQLSLYQAELQKQALQFELNSVAAQQNANAKANMSAAQVNASPVKLPDSTSPSSKAFIEELRATRGAWIGSAGGPNLPKFRDIPNAQRLADQWVAVVNAAGLGKQYLKELTVAQRITAERRLKIISELQSVVQEMYRLQAKQVELFEKYFEHADLTGMRSRIEHRAALRELEESDAANLGAQFVLAVTLSRLDRMDHSLAVLNQLGNSDGLRALALASRGEVLMRKGEKAAARKDELEALALGKNDVRIRLICGQANCNSADYRSAIADWEFVLKRGYQESACQRALALIYSSLPNPTKRHLELADEHAKLASALSAEQNWGCEIALALAHAANGRQNEATAAAEQAIELAIGEQKSLCQAIADDIKAGKKIAWRFE